MAKLSAHTYDTNAPLPPGYTYLDPTTPAGQQKLAAIGIKPDDLSPAKSQFRAQIFQTGTDVNPSYVVAYKGTTPSSGQDWLNNTEQSVGANSDYYKQAITLGTKIDNAESGQVSFTGHSLGGGLASAASAATNEPAITFNAAGLNPATVENYMTTDFNQATSDITAYHVSGEMLDMVQEHPYLAGMVGGGALGSLAAPITGPAGPIIGALLLPGIKAIRGDKFLPVAAGQHITLPAVPPPGTSLANRYNPVSRHGMDWVENGIKAKQHELGCP
ncbi:MAG TPA: DUF2974 domain-containing protein [Acetobacteraceae bacterium]|nr:DUF2974 domain-containing protein [Acetobacteraceae bacterium]